MHFSLPMEIISSQLSPTSWSTPAVVSSQCSSTISSAGDLIIRLIIPALEIKSLKLFHDCRSTTGQWGEVKLLMMPTLAGWNISTRGAAEFKENVYSRVRNKKCISWLKSSAILYQFLWLSKMDVLAENMCSNIGSLQRCWKTLWPS